MNEDASKSNEPAVGRTDLLDAYTDLGLAMICVEAALKRGWTDKAMIFAVDALKKLDVTLESLHPPEVSCNEITKCVLFLYKSPASNNQVEAFRKDG